MRKTNKILSILGLSLCVSFLLPLSQVYADMAAPYTFESDPNYNEEIFNNPNRTKMTPLSQYIINDESYLYKGPNERYGKNDDEYHLPSGIVVTSTYYDGVWMYIEYEGHTGWIYHYNTFAEKNPKTANLATEEYNNTFVTTLDRIELKSAPSKDSEIVATLDVTPLTTIPVLYYFSTSKTASWVYVSYGEYSGWYYKDILDYNVAFRKENGRDSCITIRETAATDTVKSDTTSFTIPANTKLIIPYYAVNNPYVGDDDKEYVEYTLNNNKLSGWINSNDVALTTYYDGKYTEKILDRDQPIFDTVKGVETGKIAEAGTYDAVYYYKIRNTDTDEDEVWYYLRKNNPSAQYGWEEIGWTKALSDTEIEALEALEKQKQEEMETVVNKEESVEVEVLVEEDPNANTREQIISTIVWLLIGFGLLSATIIIVLIVQKKHETTKDNSSEPSEPEKPEEPESKEPTNEPESKEAEPKESTDEPEPNKSEPKEIAKEPESNKTESEESEESDNA